MDMIKERAAMREFEQRIINDWRTEIGFNKPVGYWYDYGARNLVIYTDSPGQIIGKMGANIGILMSLLSEKLFGTWTIELVEIRGGFVV